MTKIISKVKLYDTNKRPGVSESTESLRGEERTDRRCWEWRGSDDERDLKEAGSKIQCQHLRRTGRHLIKLRPFPLRRKN